MWNKVCQVYITSHFIRGEKGGGEACRGWVSCNVFTHWHKLVEVGFGIAQVEWTWPSQFHSRYIVTDVQGILGNQWMTQPWTRCFSLKRQHGASPPTNLETCSSEYRANCWVPTKVHYMKWITGRASQKLSISFQFWCCFFH
jgi:hypothetical protein